jgi:hypothetical protein
MRGEATKSIRLPLDKVPEGDEARCFGNDANRFGTKNENVRRRRC